MCDRCDTDWAGKDCHSEPSPVADCKRSGPGGSKEVLESIYRKNPPPCGPVGKAEPIDTVYRIRLKCEELADLLVRKNEAYGDAALNPNRTFARGSASDLIRARIDDKLSRIRNNPEAFGEDPVVDLAGYLILLMLAIEDEKVSSPASGMADRTGN